jgi:hypothetical protein
MSLARRKFIATVVICAAAALFGVFPGSCAEYYATGAITAVDLCSILNCESSNFFNLCSPVPLLADCPTVTGT